VSEFGHSYRDSDTERKFQLFTATLIIGSQSDTSSSSGSGGCVSAGEVIGIAIASFVVGAFVTWGSVIVSRFQKPPEKITANGTQQGEDIVSEANEHDDD
jgi:hypothetical protein